MFNIIGHFVGFGALYRYVRFKSEFRVKEHPELPYRFVKAGGLYPKTFYFYYDCFLTGGFILIKILKLIFSWIKYENVTIALF